VCSSYIIILDHQLAAANTTIKVTSSGWSRLPISEKLRQRSIPFTDESFCQLGNGLSEWDAASPHLWPRCLGLGVSRYEAISVHFGEDEPAVVPGSVRGGILIDAAFGFFEAFGARWASEVAYQYIVVQSCLT